MDDSRLGFMAIKAREAREARKAAGLGATAGPLEKARAEPKSMRKAITAFCYECMGGDGEPGARGFVRDCTAPQCALYPLRPWQK